MRCAEDVRTSVHQNVTTVVILLIVQQVAWLHHLAPASLRKQVKRSKITDPKTEKLNKGTQFNKDFLYEIVPLKRFKTHFYCKYCGKTLWQK